PPGPRQRREVARDPHPPVLAQPGGIPGRRLAGVPADVLVRRGGERERQPADVLDQVAERVRRARRRLAQLVVPHPPRQVGQPLGRGPQIHVAHGEGTTREPGNHRRRTGPPGRFGARQRAGRGRTKPPSIFPTSIVPVPVVTTGSPAAKARNSCSSSASTTPRPHEPLPSSTGPKITIWPDSTQGRQ